MDFAKKLCKAKNKLLELDTSYKIDELYFIYKFLSSVDLSFDIFCATFNQTQSLLLIKTTEETISTMVVTFDETVMAAEKK